MFAKTVPSLLKQWIVAICLSLLPFSVYASESNEIPPNAERIDQKLGDVTGDKKEDVVTLFGVKEENTVFYKHVFVKIDNPNSKKTSVITLEEGFYPQLYLCDLDGDGISDIFVNVDTGGSGGIVNSYLYSAVGDVIAKIPLPEPLNVTAKYKDNYVVVLSIVGQNKQYPIDLSDRKQIYEEIGVYKNGKIVNPPEITVNPFGVLKPVDQDGDGMCELQGMQRVTGVANADTLGLALSVWKLKKGQWILIQSSIEKA